MPHLRCEPAYKPYPVRGPIKLISGVSSIICACVDLLRERLWIMDGLIVMMSFCEFSQRLSHNWHKLNSCCSAGRKMRGQLVLDSNLESMAWSVGCHNYYNSYTNIFHMWISVHWGWRVGWRHNQRTAWSQWCTQMCQSVQAVHSNFMKINTYTDVTRSRGIGRVSIML